MERLNNIPEVGKYYHFWDDGKLSPSRHYICRVEEVIPYEDCKNITATDQISGRVINLHETIKDSMERCPWIYANTTDVVIKCSIPVYDKDPIYFIRTVDGGFFSIAFTAGWQEGRLDVDSSIWNHVIENITDKDLINKYKSRKYEDGN